MTTNIYILKLQNGKYYVGKTNNIEQRIKQHKNGNATSWTTKHKFISVEKIIPDANIFDEDKYTKIYMDKYGIDNVRGGSYVSEQLDDIQKYSLQKEFWGAKNLCTKCGRSTHFIKNCYAKTDINGCKIFDLDDNSEKEYIYVCNFCDEEFIDEIKCISHEKYCKSKQKISKKCYNCGKRGHYANNCHIDFDDNSDDNDNSDNSDNSENNITLNNLIYSKCYIFNTFYINNCIAIA